MRSLHDRTVHKASFVLLYTVASTLQAEQHLVGVLDLVTHVEQVEGCYTASHTQGNTARCNANAPYHGSNTGR